MDLSIKPQTIRHFLSKESIIIILILILAYVLRILPYLLGYSIPFAEEGMRDFEQVQYLINNNQINWGGGYLYYGSFPVLHLLVFGISKLGFDPLKIFLFVPQVFASLGILFFYLFLRRHYSVKVSLLASFLIAIFIPHIYWSAQPMRETIGLFFFPLIIYLFDREMAPLGLKTTRASIINKIFLVLSLILIILSHSWSVIMIIGWLLFYSFFFIKNNEKLAFAFLLVIFFLSGALIYWYFLFPWALELTSLVFEFLLLVLLFAVLGLLIITFRKNYNLGIIKNGWGQFVFLILSFIFLIIIAAKAVPINYPIQIWLQFIIFFIFIFIGFFYYQSQKMDNLTSINTFYLIIWLISIIYIVSGYTLKEMPLDPFRTMEFAIFSLSVLVAVGFLKIADKVKYIWPFLVTTLIILATFAYPSIYIYKTSFAGTIFYDIRSDIRYISPAVQSLIQWANDRGYRVESPITEITTYQAVFYPAQEKKINLITIYDQAIKGNYQNINDPIVGVLSVEQWPNEPDISNSKIIHSNEEGFLLEYLYNDAEFVSQEVPPTLVTGEQKEVIITIKNIGNITFTPEGEYGLKICNDSEAWGIKKIWLSETIAPGETYKFKFNIIAPQKPGVYDFQWQMKQKDIEWFGAVTPKVKISVIKGVNK